MLERIKQILRIKQSVSDGLLSVAGTDVPDDGTPGFATGCLFQKTNGGAGTSLYVNEGTIKSCDFNAIAGAK